MSDDRPNLAAVKLRSHIRTITGDEIDAPTASTSGPAAGRLHDDAAFFLAAPQPSGADPTGVRSLGPALRWARSQGASQLHLIAEHEQGPDLARRAEALTASTIDISVWTADGPRIEAAVSRPALEPPTIPPAHRALAGLISEAGALPVDDHGLLVAEVTGLEVARVVDGPPGEPDAGPRLDVGVGQADRELQSYIHGHLDDDANLRRAIAAVISHRRQGAGGHPLTRMARQRWLRSILLEQPGLVGLTDLEPVIPLRPRTTVLGAEPAAAATDGTIVVCSVGVDVDLIPEAADYRLRDQPDADLILVVPERDRVLASGLLDLVERARIVSIDEPWAGAGG